MVRGSTPCLFSNKLARDARDVGIERAHESARVAWKSEALHAIYEVCRLRHEFLVDEVWMTLDARGIERPREGRAIAGVLRRATRLGWCTKTGVQRSSAQVQCHANPRMVWRSLIHGMEER